MTFAELPEGRVFVQFGGTERVKFGQWGIALNNSNDILHFPELCPVRPTNKVSRLYNSGILGRVYKKPQIIVNI